MYTYKERKKKKKREKGMVGWLAGSLVCWMGGCLNLACTYTSTYEYRREREKDRIFEAGDCLTLLLLQWALRWQKRLEDVPR